MRWMRRSNATLDDVVEVLHGLGANLMKIDAKLEEVVLYLEGEDDGDAES